MTAQEWTLTINDLDDSPAHKYLKALYSQWRVIIDSYEEMIAGQPNATEALPFLNNLYEHQRSAFGALLAAKRAQNLCAMTDCYSPAQGGSYRTGIYCANEHTE